jgi:3-phosphoglycerate kinase
MTIEDATGDGEILFDVELGFVTKAIQRQKMKMIMSVGGQKISQDIEGTTTTIFRLAN